MVVRHRWQHIEYVIGFNLDRRMFDVLQCMPTVPGAIGAFRRRVLEAVGGLSIDTLAEDTDLTMAICRAGWRVVYEETAIAWTEAPASLRQLWRQRYRWCYGTLQSMWKHTLWALPLQQIVYRQLMYLVVIQSLVTAVLGAPLRWHVIRRTGTATPVAGSAIAETSAIAALGAAGVEAGLAGQRGVEGRAATARTGGDLLETTVGRMHALSPN